MAPIAAGFLVLIGTAALLGVLVGAIGGAVTWRLRLNLVLGALLTTGALLLTLIAFHHEDLVWLRPELTWGISAMLFTFLVASIWAEWIEARATLRPAWIALGACGVALSVGFLYLLLFRISPQVQLRVGVGADIGLISLLLLARARRWMNR